MGIENPEVKKPSGEKYTCATCNTIVRGANGRTFCILNQSAPEGQIPSDISIERLEPGMEVTPIMVRRIMNGMFYPYEENACSYHPEVTRREEMRGIEQTRIDWEAKPVDEWPLSIRVVNVLKSESITLKELIEMGEAKFRELPNMGKKSALEVRHFMISIGVDWKKE